MNRPFRLLPGFTGFLFLACQAGVHAQSPAVPEVPGASAAETPAAGTVGEGEIIEALAKLDDKEREALAADPDLLKQVAQLTLIQRLLLQEARAKGWDQKEEVQAKVERAKEKALAESWLQSLAEPPPEYPSEEELKTAWEARKEAWAAPQQYRLAQIFVACPPSADKTATAKAEAKLAAVKKELSAYKKDFSAIAKDGSDDDASAAQGGEIGWLTEAQIQPELRPLITRLLKHEVSKPVRLADGWHILKCLERREAGIPPLAEVRVQLTAQLRAEKTKANSEAAVARLLRENPVTITDVALSGALNRKPK